MNKLLNLILLSLLLSFNSHASSMQQAVPQVAGKSQAKKDADQTVPAYRSSIIVGHNLTPTSYTLAKGQFAAGLYSILYGITDNLTVGTSPFMFFQYNMPMVNVKYGFVPFALFDHASVEAMYFRSVPILANDYLEDSTCKKIKRV